MSMGIDLTLLNEMLRNSSEAKTSMRSFGSSGSRLSIRKKYQYQNIFTVRNEVVMSKKNQKSGYCFMSLLVFVLMTALCEL